MSTSIKVLVQQDGKTTSKATARTHEVHVDRPGAKGGADRGPMGGELMLAGIGGCFMSNLLAAIAVRDAEVSGCQVEVVAELVQQPSRFAAIELLVSGNYTDAEEFEKLVTISERACISVNTVRSSVDMKVRVVHPTT